MKSILVTLDSNYLKPLKVMLKSLFINNPNEEFDIYLMHSSIKEEELEDLDRFIEAEGGRLKIVQINDSYLKMPRHFFTTRRQCTTGFWHLNFCRRNWTVYCIWTRIS